MLCGRYLSQLVRTLRRTCSAADLSLIKSYENFNGSKSYLGPLDCEEVNTALSGERTGCKGFTTPRRAVQQDTTGWAYAEARKRLRMPQRPLDAFAELLRHKSLPTDVGPPYSGHFERDRTEGGGLDEGEPCFYVGWGEYEM